MSSTENTADRAQQPIESREGTTAGVTTDAPEAAEQAPAGSEAVTPEAGTPAAETPGEAAAADPTADDAPATDTVPSGSEVTEASDAIASPAPDGAAGDPAAAEPAADVTTPDASTTATPTADPPEVAGEIADAATPAAAPVPAPPPAPAPASDPTQWGRVDDEGTVYVRTSDGGERAVGSWQAGEPAEGLAHYGRRYDDLATEVGLLEARLRARTGNPNEIRTKAQALAEQVPTADVVGDLPALASRLGTIIDAAEGAAAVSRAEKAAARAGQIAKKEALAAEAEQIAAESTQWKAAGDRLKAIVEEWKTIKGIDRKTDEALWTRFAAARDAFGRRRGAHFAALDVQRGESRAAKSELIAEAEKLSTSTEWGPTSAAMRSLMDRWKAVPRTGRDTDDDLWKKFRAAQDVFFAARTESDKARNSEQQGNQEKKEALLAEAEKIDPTRDLRGAQNALRKIQERYDAIGHVPREVMRSLEDRMQAVEDKVRGAADSSRPRTVAENPMLTSLRAAATKAEEQLAKARAAGDAQRIADAEANLASRQEFLAAAERAGSRR